MCPLFRDSAVSKLVCSQANSTCTMYLHTHAYDIVLSYRGGLDVIGDQTGEHSVYTEYKGRQIMYHVSTLLPFDEQDQQHVRTNPPFPSPSVSTNFPTISMAHYTCSIHACISVHETIQLCMYTHTHVYGICGESVYVPRFLGTCDIYETLVILEID